MTFNLYDMTWLLLAIVFNYEVSFYIHVNFLACCQSEDCAWIAQHNKGATSWMTEVRLSAVEGYFFMKTGNGKVERIGN